MNSACHILNGDALREQFRLASAGEVVVMRECLLDGPLSGDNDDQFFRGRELFLSGAFGDDVRYAELVKNEFDRLASLPKDTMFCLWFGYDLFCLMNMLFVIDFLRRHHITGQIFVVYPSNLSIENRWDDFGSAGKKELELCYNRRLLLNDDDIGFAVELWDAFKTQDLITIERMSVVPRNAFPFLKEVCQAHIERFVQPGNHSRPEKVLLEIMQRGTTTFGALFNEFRRREGVYGFGDTQVKAILSRMNASLQ